MRDFLDSAVGPEGEVFLNSIRDLLTIVFKRRWLILAILFTVVTVVMLSSLTKPRTYRVTATLLVNQARAEVPLGPSDSQQLIVNKVTEEDLNSEIEILRSRSLIEKVVESVGESGSAPIGKKSWVKLPINWLRSLMGGTHLSKTDRLTVHLQEEVEIFSVRTSNVIKIAYQSQDPGWATKIVGTLTDRYLEQRAEMYQSPQAFIFFEGQMLEAQQRLAEREKALEKYAAEASITMVEGVGSPDSLAAQKRLVMGRLSSLKDDLASAQVQLQASTREVTSLRGMLRNEPERLESSSQMHQDATTEEIRRRLAALKLERDRLLQDFKPESRYVRDIDAQIKMAEDRLEQAKSESNVGGTESNPVYLQLKGELLRAEAGLEATRARVTFLMTQVVEYQKELDDLNAKGFGLEDLRREVDAAEEDYLLYRKKHEEARISAAMNQEKFINVNVAQPAQMPLTPEPRGLMRKMFLSLMVGLLGGFGVAFLWERFVNRSFTTGEDIERRLGIPHIASIPDGIPAG